MALVTTDRSVLESAQRIYFSGLGEGYEGIHELQDLRGRAGCCPHGRQLRPSDRLVGGAASGEDAVELKVTAPSGRSLDIVSADDCPVIGVNTFVTFGPGAWMRDYQIGRHGYHKVACRELEPAELIWREYIAGNELMVSSNRQSVTVATLRGPYHELMGVFGGPTPPRDLVRSVFLDIDVVDDPTGMSVSPAPGNPMSILREDATIVVKDRGVIHVVGPDNASAIAPSVPGTPTKFGEIWRRDVTRSEGTNGNHNGHFILAQSHATAEVSLRMFPATPEEDLLNWIDNLQIAWR